MKHLPCIPDEVVSAEDRRWCRELELFDGSPTLTPNERAGNRKLLSIIDGLAGAYLDVARERDKWKGVCELATDEEFWNALEALKEKHGRKTHAAT